MALNTFKWRIPTIVISSLDLVFSFLTIIVYVLGFAFLIYIKSLKSAEMQNGEQDNIDIEDLCQNYTMMPSLVDMSSAWYFLPFGILLILEVVLEVTIIALLWALKKSCVPIVIMRKVGHYRIVCIVFLVLNVLGLVHEGGTLLWITLFDVALKGSAITVITLFLKELDATVEHPQTYFSVGKEEG